jgi:hypothetical protein
MEFVGVSFLIIVVFFILLALMPQDVANSIKDVIAAIKYGDLSLVDHAQTSHAEQTWNATTIQTYFDEYCDPYQCDRGNGTAVAFCEAPDSPGKSVGLVINTITHSIITGFKATTGYWEGQCP